MSDRRQADPVDVLTRLIDAIKAGDAALAARDDVLRDLECAKSELARAREFDFREIGDHLYDGIYVADGTGKTLYVNTAYSRITGLAREEVVGRQVGDLVAAGLYKNAVTPEVIKQRKQVNAVGESARNGTRMLITGNPILDEQGRVKMVVVVDREITDLSAMQAELEATQEKMKAVEAATVRSSREIEHLRDRHLNRSLNGHSTTMRNVLRLIEQVADLDVTVLISGETGVGKEVVADEIYRRGARRNKPFIKVNCAAIPANLLEAELFGYEKGAFTGAVATGRIGLFELADKGTLLLDEIGDMPLELQSKLLRVIQHKEVTRVGGTRPHRLDVRILASTNCDLRGLVRQGKFREDLFYRLAVFPIPLAPLRDRPEDIEVIAQQLLATHNAKYDKAVAFDPPAVSLMQRYRWPGNVRELQNVIERLVIVSDRNAVIDEARLATLLEIPAGSREADMAAGLHALVEDVERRTITYAMARCGTTRRAAEFLKVDQSTIVKKAKRLGIHLDR